MLSNSAQVSSNDKPQGGNVGEDIPQQSAAIVHSDIVSLYTTEDSLYAIEEEIVEEASLYMDANDTSDTKREEETEDMVLDIVLLYANEDKDQKEVSLSMDANQEASLSIDAKKEASLNIDANNAKRKREEEEIVEEVV